MLRFILSCIIFFQLLNISAQTKNNCDTLLKVTFNIKEINKKPKEFQQRLHLLFKCMELSKIEITSFVEVPILSSILVNVANKKDANYADLKSEILRIVKTANFKKTVTFKTLENTVASLENWATIKELLTELNAPQEIINKTHTYLKNNKTSNPVLFKEITKHLTNKSTPQSKTTINRGSKYTNTEEILNKILKQPKKIDFNLFLNKAKEKNKKLLLFFTGYACVNCVKMSDYLANPEIYAQLKEHYYLVPLFVDDNELLPENEWTNSKRKKGKILKTLGDQAFELQLTKFRFSAQPLFVIINHNGNELARTSYTSLENLKEFLIKN